MGKRVQEESGQESRQALATLLATEQELDARIAAARHEAERIVGEGAAAARQAEDELPALIEARTAQLNSEIEAQLHGKPALGDAEVLGLLQKMVKQRQESVQIYDNAGRGELADRERAEIEIIKAYLPQQMSEAQAKAVIADIIEQTGAPPAILRIAAQPENGPQLSCGAQDPPRRIEVTHDAKPDPRLGTAGDVVTYEVR